MYYSWTEGFEEIYSQVPAPRKRQCGIKLSCIIHGASWKDRVPEILQQLTGTVFPQDHGFQQHFEKMVCTCPAASARRMKSMQNAKCWHSNAPPSVAAELQEEIINKVINCMNLHGILDEVQGAILELIQESRLQNGKIHRFPFVSFLLDYITLPYKRPIEMKMDFAQYHNSTVLDGVVRDIFLMCKSLRCLIDVDDIVLHGHKVCISFVVQCASLEDFLFIEKCIHDVPQKRKEDTSTSTQCATGSEVPTPKDGCNIAAREYTPIVSCQEQDDVKHKEDPVSVAKNKDLLIMEEIETSTHVGNETVAIEICRKNNDKSHLGKPQRDLPEDMEVKKDGDTTGQHLKGRT